MVSGELISLKKIKGLNWGGSNLSTYFNIKLLRYHAFFLLYTNTYNVYLEHFDYMILIYYIIYLIVNV